MLNGIISMKTILGLSLATICAFHIMQAWKQSSAGCYLHKEGLYSNLDQPKPFSTKMESPEELNRSYKSSRFIQGIFSIYNSHCYQNQGETRIFEERKS